jgi:hypothetical protein
LAWIYVPVLFMTSDDMADEQDRILMRLANLGLEFAEELKAQVKLVKSEAEAEGLTLAFHRAARSSRLAIALQAKLARDRLELKKLQRSDAAQDLKTRKTQVRTVLRNEIYIPEAEQDAADAMAERLDERLDEEALFDKFLQIPVEQAIARLRKDLGLPYVPGEAVAEAAGGGPSAEEPMVEGAGQAHNVPPLNPLIPAQAGPQAEPEPAPDEQEAAQSQPP